MKNKTREELISVIVPIYNVEKYLNKCIDSILNQTYSNLEIILVDDGSPDNSGKICDDYKKIDSRIVVIHKKNSGLSDARNVGMKYAHGKYVAFIDSDDYISTDYFEYLLNLIYTYDADMSIVLEKKFVDNQKFSLKNKKEKITVYNSIDALKIMLYQKEFNNAAWGKLYLLDKIKNFKFPVGKLYEDIGTVYKFILNCDRVVYSNQKKYYYLQRKDSIMGSPFKLKEMDYIYQSEIMLNDISKLKNESLFNACKCRYVNANFSIILKIGKNIKFKEQKNEALLNIKKYRLEVLLDFKSRLKTKIALLLTYFNLL